MTTEASLRPIRYDDRTVEIIDQTLLPHALEWHTLRELGAAARAIRDMQVRGAPLIGVTAAWGVALAMRADASDAALQDACKRLAATRPTAVNLGWALAHMHAHLAPLAPARRAAAAWAEAAALCERDAATNAAIGAHGLEALRPLQRAGHDLRLMTHCNAGWLATVAHGTALAPIYRARREGVAVHVLVSETRPRNQGLLTAWELSAAGVPNTLVADNAAAWLMARGEVDAVIVGADRIAANGDAANKIGTSLKALAAREYGVPFFVAAPGSTIDWDCPSGANIPIEERDADELRRVRGLRADGTVADLALCAPTQAVRNPAFDVTPARLIEAIVCERGTAAPARLRTLYAEPAGG